MITAGIVYFLLCAVVALSGAVMVVASRNPIRSAVALLVSILGVAGLYLKLHAEFLAAIQVIVYAGAVVVLFVFVIMLLGPDSTSRAEQGHAHIARAVGAALIAALGLAGIVLLAPGEGAATAFPPAAVGHGSVEAVGTQLFRQALFPFELATALLIVAVVAAIAISRGRGVRKVGAAPIENPTLRLFGGAIHPRDAVRPRSGEETE